MNFERMIDRKVKGTLSRWFGIQFQSKSETAKVRSRVLAYCKGKGCDIGFGGDKIMKQNCCRFMEYGRNGTSPGYENLSGYGRRGYCDGFIIYGVYG